MAWVSDLKKKRTQIYTFFFFGGGGGVGDGRGSVARGQCG